MQAAITFTVLVVCSHLLPLYNFVEIHESESDEFNEINNVIVDSFYDSFLNMADNEKTKDPAQKTMFLETYPETGEDLEDIFPEYRIRERVRGAGIVHKLAPKRPVIGRNPTGKQEKRENTSTNINATIANNTTDQKNSLDENNTFLDAISALNFMTNPTAEKKAPSNGANNDHFDKVFDSHKKNPFILDDYGTTDLGNDPFLSPFLTPCTDCAKSLYTDHKCPCGDPLNEAVFYKPLNEELLSFQDMETQQFHNDQAKLISKNPNDNVLNVKLNLQIELPNNMDRMKIMENYMPGFLSGIPPSDFRPTHRHNHEKHHSKDMMENKLFRPSYNIPFPVLDIPFSPLFDTYPTKEMKMKTRRRNPAVGKSANSKKKVTRVRVKTLKKKTPNQHNSTLIEKPKRIQRVSLSVTEGTKIEQQVETTTQNYVDQTTPQSVFLTTSQTENALNFITPTALETQTMNNETEMVTVKTSNDTETPKRRKRSISQDSANYLAKINKQYIQSDYADPKIKLNNGMTSYPPTDQVESNIQVEDNIAHAEKKKFRFTPEGKTDSENELLYWPEFRMGTNYDFEVKNITSLMVQRENNRLVNVSEETIRRNHMKALEQAVFGEVDWTDMDTVVPAFMSFVGKYLHGVISFCSDSICHSMKCEQQMCIHRLCLPNQRRNKIGHCNFALGAESIAPMTTMMDLPSKSVFEIMDIMKEKLKRKVFGKVTLCITGKCMSFVYTRKFFAKAKCSASNLDTSGHCAGTITDKRETVDLL